MYSLGGESISLEEQEFRSASKRIFDAGVEALKALVLLEKDGQTLSAEDQVAFEANLKTRLMFEFDLDIEQIDHAVQTAKKSLLMVREGGVAGRVLKAI